MRERKGGHQEGISQTQQAHSWKKGWRRGEKLVKLPSPYQISKTRREGDEGGGGGEKGESKLISRGPSQLLQPSLVPFLGLDQTSSDSFFSEFLALRPLSKSSELIRRPARGNELTIFSFPPSLPLPSFLSSSAMSQLPFYNYQSPYAPIYQPPYISSSNFQGPSYSYPPPILPQQDLDQAQLQPSSSSQRPLLPPPWPIQPALNLPKPNPSFWKYLKVQADTFATMFSRSRACTSVQLNALSRKIAQNFTDAVKGIPNPSGLTSSAADAATYELIVRTLHQLYSEPSFFLSLFLPASSPSRHQPSKDSDSRRCN